MVKRKRALGNNEQSSAKLAIEYMTGVNKETGEEVFTESDRQKVQEAILLTVPNFDVSLGTVTQPEFVKYKGNLVAQAVALADLGGGGMEGSGTARWEADSLYIEDNLDIAQYFRSVNENGERDREKKNSINKDYWHGLIPRFILAKADNLNYS
ncbi:hypothetical protein A3D77_07585 [Candidatus Gottesmanbacteria bacterium RIFCSPHIGHO2_02_FULL_39_11]|uniref:Uncharacterized protein n=1 Tax=Candidatus Gottesmanbacteria bacterium RIFCSPHIGHO2_02_FULL_39_11 TaxID=1798382 RepID=A0A1F5ZSQ1_9BACT|nr:MAG: hypothetical protein A3D77_07585 [Candidatus Gottesmanbacteria bacterium RIFCSPHIGHO2_02_FULL_39_11]